MWPNVQETTLPNDLRCISSPNCLKCHSSHKFLSDVFLCNQDHCGQSLRYRHFSPYTACMYMLWHRTGHIKSGVFSFPPSFLPWYVFNFTYCSLNFYYDQIFHKRILWQQGSDTDTLQVDMMSKLSWKQKCFGIKSF